MVVEFLGRPTATQKVENSVDATDDSGVVTTTRHSVELVQQSGRVAHRNGLAVPSRQELTFGGSALADVAQQLRCQGAKRGTEHDNFDALDWVFDILVGLAIPQRLAVENCENSGR